MTRYRMYNYNDGNGNKFVIKRESVEYIPVKPIFSSSGIYDGGEHVIKEISRIQYDKIVSILRDGLRNKENHIKNRVKGSGMIVLNNKPKKDTFILKPHSEELIKIEKILYGIINRS